MRNKKQYIWALLRLALGLIFLWAFFDKLFGLGFATALGESWLSGGSPTLGFLKFGTHGPFVSVYQGLAGSPLVDWLFMIGLLLIGMALIIGIGIKIASYSGALLMLLMWLAALPPEHHPFLDEHIIYLIILIGLVSAKLGQCLGLGKWWAETKLVKKFSFLE